MKPDNNSPIPGMDLDNKYSAKVPIMPQNTSEAQKEMEKTKKELEKLKSWIVKKFKFTMSLSVLPPQMLKVFVDEEELPKETESHVQLYMIVPEEQFKKIPEMKKEIVEYMDANLKQKAWIQIKTPVDIWENCLNSKFDLVSAVGMSYPIFDTGILGGLRVAEIHKSLVLQKFEKYVVSYVVGGSLVRGEMVKTSDVDVFVIINDTDVKRMPRLELKERLRSMIYQYISEATALAGVDKNVLNVQIYLLTEFWEAVKDAHPVMFTFIRDGVPLYDRGTFLPWKALLKMGKLKPSPEAIDMFMKSGEKTVERSKFALMDILVRDIFWGVSTPSQALLMLHGIPPPTPKHLVTEMKKAFLENEKMLEKKYIDILDHIVTLYKSYEHQTLKEISGTEIDKLLKDTEDYLKRLEELRKQIEKRAQEKTVEQIYTEMTDLLKIVLKGSSQAEFADKFEKTLVKTGKFTKQHLAILKDVIDAKKNFKKKKMNSHKIDEVRKNAAILINALIDFSQRCDLAIMERGRMSLRYKQDGKEQIAELLNADGKSFLFKGTEIKKISDKIGNSNMEEVSQAVESQKGKDNVEVKPGVFEILKKELGEFEIVL